MTTNQAPAKKTTDEIYAQLCEPFPPSAIEWKPQSITKDKSKALAVPFIDARDVADRLDAVVGAFNWQRQPIAANVGVGIKNPETGEWIWKYDVGFVVGEDSEKEDAQVKGIKGTASDSFKRAAALWGIARYLYKFPKQWVAWDDEHHKFATAPQIPTWALPAGTTNGNSNGNGANKMTAIQRAKLIELYQVAFMVDEADALKGLDKMFFDEFKHGGKDATYEEATRVTGFLMAQQKPAATEPKKKK